MTDSRKFRQLYCAECHKKYDINEGNFYDNGTVGTYDFVCNKCMIEIFKESEEE